MSQTRTLEIEEKVTAGEEITCQIDYDNKLMIEEIRVWSEYFHDFVPVPLSWLEKYKSSAMETIRQAIAADYGEALVERQKSLELAIYLGK